VFWVKDGASYRYRTMTEEIAMPWNWPVDVNYLEAKAFCNWKAARTGQAVRMPMEEEYARLRELMDDARDQHEWDKAPGNINLEHYASSCPVDMFRQSRAPELYDIVGNVWQWNETPMHPYDHFKVHPLYDDFTTPTYDTQHNLIKGGAWASTGNEATKDARYVAWWGYIPLIAWLSTVFGQYVR
jgi:formylglycine-generating enzyme required for sulfatase activity